MALARGKSQILCGPISLHTETAIHVAKLLTEVKKINCVEDTLSVFKFRCIYICVDAWNHAFRLYVLAFSMHV